MSDTQRDREERQHVIEVLKSWDGYFIGYTSDEVQEALRYAIASIETDLRYDLLYEETSEQADNQADKPIPKMTWDKDGACPICGYFRQWDDDAFCGHCGVQLGEVEE